MRILQTFTLAFRIPICICIYVRASAPTADLPIVGVVELSETPPIKIETPEIIGIDETIISLMPVDLGPSDALFARRAFTRVRA